MEKLEAPGSSFLFGFTFFKKKTHILTKVVTLGFVALAGISQHGSLFLL